MHDLITAQEYCFAVFDGTHATPKPQKNGKPLVTSKHILDGKLDITNAYNISIDDYTEINKRSRVHQWDILFSMIGTIGSLYLEKSDCINYAIKNLGVFSCRDEKKARFLYYFLQSDFAKRHIQKQLAGAVQKFLPLIDLRRFPVPSFNDSMYENISILRYIDDKIELNHKINSELEKITQTLYNYWFVQFDFPDEFGRPYKSSGGKMVYNEVLKREIPEGWNVLNLGERLNFEKGIEPGTDNYIENPTYLARYIKFYRVGDMDDSGNTYLFKNKFKDAPVLNPYDLVVSFDGSVGRLSFGLNGLYSSGIRRISDRLGLLDNSTLYFIFQNSYIQATIQKYASGSNILHAGSSIAHLAIAYNEKIFLTYQSIIKSLYNKMAQNKLENKQLVVLRDFLLPMLMNGQVSVKS